MVTSPNVRPDFQRRSYLNSCTLVSTSAHTLHVRNAYDGGRYTHYYY